MKLNADRPEGVNQIQAYEPGIVIVNGNTFRHSVLIPPTGEVLPWEPASLDMLQASHFDHLVEAKPEVLIFGSGQTIRFPSPAVMRNLITARIGYETMDNGAACRTFNFLVGEGRLAWAALLIQA